MPAARRPFGAEPLRIGFWGNFGTGNLGNECTLQAAVHTARSRCPGAEIVCICSGPADSTRRYGIGAVPISSRRSQGLAVQGTVLPRKSVWAFGRLWRGVRDWYRAIAVMRSLDILVMCGTGVLSDAGEGYRGLPYEMFRWSLAARLSGSTLYFASVGAESMVHPLTRVFLGASLRLANFRSYRDAQSASLLERNGISARNDPVYPDLAFSLPEALFLQPGPGARSLPIVAVGLYDYCGRGKAGGADADAYRAYIDTICRFVAWLFEHGFGVRVVLGDLPYDDPVRGELRDALVAKGVSLDGGRFQDDPATSVQQLIGQLAEADVVVATRFHSVLLALMLGKPVISISYNEKNDALMGEMGLSRYCLTIGELELERLTEGFEDLRGRGPRLGPGVREKVAGYRTELDGLYDRLFGRGRAGA